MNLQLISFFHFLYHVIKCFDSMLSFKYDYFFFFAAAIASLAALYSLELASSG